MDKIPLINPDLVKVISPTIDKAHPTTGASHTRAEQKSAPVLSAEVVSSTRVSNTPEPEYKVVLKIDQQLIETVSPHDLKKGSQLDVKVLPGPELKIISSNLPPSVTTALNNPISSPLIQQLLADRIPQIKQQDAAGLIKQLAQLLQSPAISNDSLKSSLSVGKSAPHSPTAPEPAKATNSQASARQIYQNIQPALLSDNTPSTSVAKIVHTDIQQHLKDWRLQLPNSQDISTSVGLKNALNNSGIRAETQLSQLAAQSLLLAPNDNKNNANSIFKQLQTLHQHAFSAQDKSQDKSQTNNAHTNALNLTTLVKKTAQTLADNTQQVLSGLMKKTTSSTPSSNPPTALLSPAVTTAPTSVELNWQNPLLSNPAHLSLEVLLNDPLLQNPSSNNKFALSQIIAQQGRERTLAHNDNAHRIPMNWPERAGSDSQLLRNLQNLLGHIEREQIQQRGRVEDNPLQATPQQYSQWLPLLINHNHQFQLIEFYIEQEEKNNEQGEKKQQWSINLHFELPKLGQLGIEITMFENECKTTFWSESSTTLNQLNQNIQPLRQRLTEQGIIVNDLQSRHGMLAKSQNNIQQRLVDIKT